MKLSTSTPLFGPDAQAALHAELAAAAGTPALRPLVLHPEPDLGPRFVGYWRQLSALPRRTRRSLQRRWKRSLAAIALLMALGQVPALAATIAVDGSTCTLVDAITAANTDAPTGGCPAGNGADTLVLAAGSTHTLTTVAYGSDENETGLPLVTSTITIAGNGSTVERGAGAPEMRLMAVSDTGNLALHGLTLRRGSLPLTYVDEYGSEGSYTLLDTSGGGILNDGTLTITNSTVSGNGSAFGGGVNNRGTLTLTNSTVSGNRAFRGGGVDNRGTLTLADSTVSGNSGSGFFPVTGGGVSNRGTLTLTNSTVSGNSVSSDTIESGGGVYNRGTLILNRSVISGNTAFSGPEVYHFGTVHADDFNVVGLNGNAGIYGFSPGPTDIIPAGPLGDILAPLADNGKDWLIGDHGDDALDGGAEPDKCQGGANGPSGDTAINCEKVFGVP